MEKYEIWMHCGQAIPGRQLGRRLGSPTINLPLKDQKVPRGIFVGLAVLANRAYPAVVHVGPRPAIGDPRPIIEAHLLARPPRSPIKAVSIIGIYRLRTVRKFPTLAALRRQIQRDIARARQWWGL